MRIKPSTVIAISVLVFLIMIIVLSLAYPPNARLFPLMIAIPVSALVIYQIIKEIRTKPATNAPAQKTVDEEEENISLGKFLLLQLWFVALLLSLYLFGFLLGSALLTFAYLKSHRQSWLVSVLVPLIMAAVIWGGLIVALKSDLYEGLLFTL
jgi:hypothetical protein